MRMFSGSEVCYSVVGAVAAGIAGAHCAADLVPIGRGVAQQHAASTHADSLLAVRAQGL